MQTFSCIIAFYNEDDNLLSVLATISEIEIISEIICVDDGSTNDTSQLVRRQYPKVNLIKFDTNKGKAFALSEGLKVCKNDQILLMDADLKYLKSNEIANALRSFHNDIDMIILENKGGNTWIDPYINKNIFLSGQRIMRKKDLEAVFSSRKPSGYQLEVAINAHMMNKSKKVFHVKTSSFNPHKVQKHGLIQGLINDLKMDVQIIRYLGVINYLKQLRSFGKNELV